MTVSLTRSDGKKAGLQLAHLAALAIAATAIFSKPALLPCQFQSPRPISSALNVPLPQLFLLPFPEPALQSPTVLSHDQDVPTLVLRWQEDLRNHNKDLALGWGVDVPDALHASWVVAWVVGRLDVASKLA